MSACLSSFGKSSIFYIDSDNLSSIEEGLFGYSFLDNQGIWNTIEREGKKLIIKGSYLQPVIHIYEEDNFFALSNSAYTLKEELKDRDIILRENKSYLRCLSLIREDRFGKGYGNNEAFEKSVPMFEGCRINDNFSYIEIYDNKVHIIEKENDYSSIKVDSSFIEEWHLKYKNFLNELFNERKARLSLSGGLDSRLIFSMCKDNENLRIKTKDYKNPEIKANQKIPYDGLYSREILTRFRPDLLPVIKNKKENNTIKKNKKKSTVAYFGFGNFEHWDNVHRNEDLNLSYLIKGVGSEPIRDVFIGDVDFFLGWMRRVITSQSLDLLEKKGTIVITPFLDSSLLRRRVLEPCEIHRYLYNRYYSEMLETPFTMGINSYYFK